MQEVKNTQSTPTYEKTYRTPRMNIREFENENLVVLRDKRTHRALNVSWTEQGLMFTTNKYGRSLYFVDAVLRVGDKMPYFSSRLGTLKKSPDVYVEKFTPRIFASENPRLADRLNQEEGLWVDKARKLSGMRGIQ